MNGFRNLITPRNYFSLKALFLFLFSSYLLFNCSDQSNQNAAQPSVLAYLNKPEHLTDKHYKDSFNIHFNRFQKAGDIANAVKVIEAHGDALDLAFVPDSQYVKTTEQFLKQHQKQLNEEQLVSLNYFLGSQYDLMGDLNKTMYHLKKTQLNTSSDYAKKMSALGRTVLADKLKNKGDYYDAMTLYLKNIAYFEEQKDSINLGSIYNNLAAVYKNLKVYDESEKCLQKSLKLSIGVKDTINIWFAYINLARPNMLAPNPQKTLKYARLTKALHDKWSTKSDFHTANTYAIYANALLLNNQLDSVFYYLSIAEKHADPESRTQFDLMEMRARTDVLLGQPLQQKAMLENEYKEAKLRNDVPVMEMLSTILSDNSYRENNYPDAYRYLAEKYRLRDSSWMNDSKLNLIYLDKKFQLERKEKRIAQQQLKISQDQFIFYIIGFSIVIILFIGVIITIRRKRKRAEQEAFRQEQFTFQLLQNTEEERSRIANELHDSVNHELLTIKNALVHGKSVDIEQVAGIIEEVRTISRNLHPAVLETIGLEASIEQLCERLTENGLFTTCEIEYEQPLDKNTELQLYRIIQESLNNTLKHGKADAAKVDIVQTANSISVSIKDNGSGFNVEEQLNSPRSFGLQSLLQRAKSIAGTITITSSEKGSIVHFNKVLEA